MKKADPKLVDDLKKLEMRRNRHAHNLGIAFVELELTKAKLLTEKKVDMMERLGAAVAEFEGFRNFWMGKVAEDCKKTEEIGDLALRSAGLDPKAKTYTIDLSTALIKELRAGQWIDVETA